MFEGPTKAAHCARSNSCPHSQRGTSTSEPACTPANVNAGVTTGVASGVHIGAHVAALAGSGEVLASRTVRDLSAGSDLTFEDRGTHHLKGVPEEWQLFRVR